MNEEGRSRIPDKVYFRIGEVSQITGVEPYVLRYWESEFHEIQPIRRKSQRLYDRETIALILQIKDLLYGEHYTIAGAKKKLREDSEEVQKDTGLRQLLNEVLEDLRAIDERIG